MKGTLSRASDRALVVLGLLAAAGLVGGLVSLFTLRFQSGDIYPPYSSLRSDPLGTRALYDSLASCPGFAVRRNYEPLEAQAFPRDTTLLFLGDTISWEPNLDALPSDTASRLTAFMRRGGRLVITLLPRTWIPGGEASQATNSVSVKTPRRRSKPSETSSNAAPEEVESPSEGEPADGLPPDTEEDEELARWTDLTNWLDAAFVQVPISGVATAALDDSYGTPGLPAALSCHTALCFTNAAPDWRILYRRGDRPVVMEKPVGKGALVLSTLTFFVSNEAMRDAREPALLHWMLGGRRHIVFDELHHGLTRTPTVSSLFRKYRLHGLVGGLLILAICFIWRNAFSLVPAWESEPDSEPATGKDSVAGLVNILRRNIPESDILDTCRNEWQRSHHHGVLPDVSAPASDGGKAATRAAQVRHYNDTAKELKQQRHRAPAPPASRERQQDGTTREGAT